MISRMATWTQGSSCARFTSARLVGRPFRFRFEDTAITSLPLLFPSLARDEGGTDGGIALLTIVA